jgi:hypothetical protein
MWKSNCTRTGKQQFWRYLIPLTAFVTKMNIRYDERSTNLDSKLAVSAHDVVYVYYFLWLCSPARAMASCGSAAQRGLWPPLALQPSAGYDFLWLCSPAWAMASCGSAAQRGLWLPLARQPNRGLWPPVALQPSAGYGLLWLCSPARSMASSGSAAQRGLWPPRSRGFHHHTQRRATVGRIPLDERSVRRKDLYNK